MRWLGLLVAASGCTFAAEHPTAAPDARPPGDGAATSDAAKDGPTGTPACTASASNDSLDDSGTAGGTGGSVDPTQTLTCDHETDMLVGIAFEMSDQSTCNNMQSALAVAITCAPLTIDSNGAAMLGSSYTHMAAGNGGCNWSPATWTPVASCSAAAVVTGLEVHTGPDDAVLNDMTVDCTQIASEGALGSAVGVPVMDSIDDSFGDMPVPCESGHVLRELLPHDGAGLDAVELHCGVVHCIDAD